MLSSREDGEDALQQTFVRAHRALGAGRVPDAVRPWLFAIARNRCRTMLAARRESAAMPEDFELGFDGLAEDVGRRADLRELLHDLARLPDDQREALVLAELGDLSHVEIAEAIGCQVGKVKALVFQARTSLIAERDARGTPCEEIRGQLEVARGGILRRGPLRRHLRQCEPCRAYGVAVTGQRAGLAVVLPVAPTVGLKAAVLGAAGATGGAGTAAAAVALGEAVSLGTATTGAGAMATTGGIAVKGLVAKAAITIAVGAGVSGAVTVVDDGGGRQPTRAAQAAAPTASVDRRPAPPRREQTPGPGGARIVTGAVAARRAPRAASTRRRAGARRTRRAAARRLRRAVIAPRRTARRLRRTFSAPRPTPSSGAQPRRPRPDDSALRKRRLPRAAPVPRRAVRRAAREQRVRRRTLRVERGARRPAGKRPTSSKRRGSLG
jgi:RNA polymerase sigma factor (sigma-70 family)